MTKRDDGQGRARVPAAGAPFSRQDVLERSGSRIHYWLAGPEEGRLVAFTPGATMDHRMFAPQVSAVVGHNANQDNPTCFDRLLLEFLHEH